MDDLRDPYSAAAILRAAPLNGYAAIHPSELRWNRFRTLEGLMRTRWALLGVLAATLFIGAVGCIGDDAPGPGYLPYITDSGSDATTSGGGQDAAADSAADAATGTDSASADAGSDASDAGTGSETSSDAASSASFTPDGGLGAYFTISGASPLSGTYNFVNGASGSCGGTGVVVFSAAASGGQITLEVVGVVLDAGESAMTPRVKIILQLGTVDDGTYPAGQGNCSLTDESGVWPVAIDARFECTGLIGIGSGQSFGVSGYIDCPPLTP
jgi:hypothetical protein